MAEVPQSKMLGWFLRRFLVFAALRLFCNMPGTQFLGLDGLGFHGCCCWVNFGVISSRRYKVNPLVAHATRLPAFES